MIFQMASFVADSVLVITKLKKFNFFYNILPFLQWKKKKITAREIASNITQETNKKKNSLENQHLQIDNQRQQ